MSYLNAIALNYTSLEVILRRATGANHPREEIDLAEIEYTATGAINRDGPAYRPRHVWDLAYTVNAEQRDILRVMHGRWIESPGPILLYDGVEPFIETTRTRALVPGTTTRTLGGRTLYYAQFRAEFQGPLRVETLGLGWFNVGFLLTETEVVPL